MHGCCGRESCRRGQCAAIHVLLMLLNKGKTTPCMRTNTTHLFSIERRRCLDRPVGWVCHVETESRWWERLLWPFSGTPGKWDHLAHLASERPVSSGCGTGPPETQRGRSGNPIAISGNACSGNKRRELYHRRSPEGSSLSVAKDAPGSCRESVTDFNK